jgi:hypothetical protein
MNIKSLLFTLIFLSGSAMGINAQIEGYLKSKARVAVGRVGQNADKEVDKKINQAVDKEFEKQKNKKKDQVADSLSKDDGNAEAGSSDSKSKGSSKSSGDDAMSKAIMGKMGINMERPANMKDSYEYTGNIKMDLETWNEDGESQGVVDYTSQYSDKNAGFALEFNDKEKGYSTMIYDYDNELMIILSDNGKDKSGFATPLSDYHSDSVSTSASTQVTPAEQKNAENYTSGFKKTGKSKTIAGYKCEEYYFENEEGMINNWMTTDLPAELWAKMYTSSAFNTLYTGQVSGFVMESDQKHKASKDRTHMIVKEVNPKKSASISTTGYSIMTMKVPPASSTDKKKGAEK